MTKLIKTSKQMNHVTIIESSIEPVDRKDVLQYKQKEKTLRVPLEVRLSAMAGFAIFNNIQLTSSRPVAYFSLIRSNTLHTKSTEIAGNSNSCSAKSFIDDQQHRYQKHNNTVYQ